MTSNKFGIYDDVEGGAVVRVIAPGGKSFVGEVQDGIRRDGDCYFAFTVEGVPKVSGNYQVQLLDHEPVILKRSFIEQKPVRIGLN